MVVSPFCVPGCSPVPVYRLLMPRITTSLWFFAAARINDIPPISIFSIISSCAAPDFNRFFKRVQINYHQVNFRNLVLLNCCSSLSNPLRDNMPPNTFGCNVFTRPPRIDGYEVRSSTAITSTPNSRINVSVPPVEYIFHPKAV